MKLYVNAIRENDTVDSIFLVREKFSGVTKTGNPYLKLKLADRSGELEGRIWSAAESLLNSFQKDEFVRVRAKAVSFQDHLQLNIAHIERIAEGEVDLSDFLPRAERDAEAMFTSLRQISREVKDPHLGNLLRLFWEDEGFITEFTRAPASKWLHHNYLGGLLEHTLSVAQLVLKNNQHYGGLNLDLLLTGALLHDVGKIKELSFSKSFDYSDEGRLLGHILLGIEMVEAKVGQIPGFPKDLSTLLKHLLLSHHGQYLWGSPKKPMTLEAVMLHYLDDMDAKMNGIGQFLKNQTSEGSRWSPYHRAFESSFYLPASSDQAEVHENIDKTENEND